MKSMLLLLWVFGMSVMSANSQQIAFTEVPDTVFKTFHTQFASVQKSAWVREEGNKYRVTFFIRKNKHPHIAKYDSLGNWLEKNIEIEFTQLPMSVIEAIVDKFEIFKPITSARFETRDKETVYRVILVKRQIDEALNESYAIEFSPAGEVLSNLPQTFAKSDMKE